MLFVWLHQSGTLPLAIKAFRNRCKREGGEHRGVGKKEGKQVGLSKKKRVKTEKEVGISGRKKKDFQFHYFSFIRKEKRLILGWL